MCPGVHVAEASLFIVISRLLWAYDIEAKPGHPLDLKDKRSKKHIVSVVMRRFEY